MSLDSSPLRIRTADCPPHPWKNGGGVTRELLVWPLEAKGTDDWQLRISVADITEDGAFSRFEGVTRSFAVVEGTGVQLKFTGAWQSITQDSEPVVFAGEDAPDCKLISGPTRDLNVMCKTGRQAKLSKAYASAEKTCPGLFLIEGQSLQWHEQATLIQAPASAIANQHIGWWVDFL